MTRSIFLAIFTLIMAQLCYADTASLVGQIKNGLQKMQSSSNSKNLQSSLIYGGQDIARPKVASTSDDVYSNDSAILIG